MVYWDDSYDGMGNPSYTGDILMYFIGENGDQIGSADSGFSGVTFESDYTGRLYLSVGYYDEGSFGFYYTVG